MQGFAHASLQKLVNKHLCILLLQVVNPATGKLLATMAKMQATETKTAIAAAHAVFPVWSNMTAKARGAILRRWYDEIVKATDDLAVIMTMECGKPLAEAKGEIASG